MSMPNMPTAERRTIGVEIRTASNGGKKTIQGTAAVFNSLSEDLGGFREQIAPGAFKSALAGSDVRALFNHNPDMVLGRTSAGTLRLSETNAGLKFEVDVPDTSYARDLLVSMGRGDISQCSFGFTVSAGGDSWKKDSTGAYIRTINKVERLYDVSPVTYPAYPETGCALRSLENAKRAPGDWQTENRRRKLELEEAYNPFVG